MASNVLANLIAALLLALVGLVMLRAGILKTSDFKDPADMLPLAGFLMLAVAILMLRRPIQASLSRFKTRYGSERRLTLLLARLEGDDRGQGRERIREALQREFGGAVDLATWPSSLQYAEGSHSDAAEALHRTARAWLSRKGQDLLIWGRCDDDGALWIGFVGSESAAPPEMFVLTEARRLPPAFTERLSSMILDALIRQARARAAGLEGEAAALALLTRIDAILAAAVPPFVRALLLLTRSSVRFDLGERRTDNTLLRASASDAEEALRLADDHGFALPEETVLPVLASELRQLGSRLRDIDLVDQSLALLARASRDGSRVMAAGQKFNIEESRALALTNKGEIARDPALLHEAQTVAKALRETLDEVANAEQWSSIQSTLGSIQLALFEVTGDLSWVEQSVISQRASVRVSQGRGFEVWPRAMHNLANAQMALARTGDIRALVDAIATYEAALPGGVAGQLTKQGLKTRRCLAVAQARLGEVRKDPAVVERALADLSAIAHHYTPEDAPSDWADLQFKLGRTELKLGELVQTNPAHFKSVARRMEKLATYPVAMSDTALAGAVKVLRGRAMLGEGFVTADPQIVRAGIAALFEAIAQSDLSWDAQLDALLQVASGHLYIAMRYGPAEPDRLQAISAASRARLLAQTLKLDSPLARADEILSQASVA